MKKVFMSLAIVAAMFASASCACNNNSQPAEDHCCCTECEQDATKTCTEEQCAACDSSATCCKKAE